MIKTLTIDHLGREGDGVAKTEDGPVFVPYTLPGEVVRVFVERDRGEVVEVVEASKDRIEPACKHFGTCGGCSLQHMKEGAYLDWKRQQVQMVLKKHGIDFEIAHVIPVSKQSRRRAAFSYKAAKNGVHLGFHGKRSSEIVSPEECPVLHPDLEKHLVSKNVSKKAEGGFARLASLVVRAKREERMLATLGKNGVSIEMTGREPGSSRFDVEEMWGATSSFWKVMMNGDLSSVDNGDDVIESGGFSLYAPPGAFLQASADAEAALVSNAVSFLKDCKACADLFCGIGTFTLPMAKFATVLAVESEQSAIDALKKTVSKTRKIKNIRTLRRDLFKHPISHMELKKIEGVLFDPPRAGASAQCEQIVKSGVGRVSAVSCNPVSFARDARILIDGGFKMTSLQPVDQFLWSHHIELAATFER
ncbi:MAG: class I SAM-dependent RNA methyltransferase [Hyphomicrobiales bacterium]